MLKTSIERFRRGAALALVAGLAWFTTGCSSEATKGPPDPDGFRAEQAETAEEIAMPEKVLPNREAPVGAGH
jgi:hypothetical protein